MRSKFQFKIVDVIFCPNQRAEQNEHRGGGCLPVSISKGNAKMGAIQSVSLPSGVTCRVCECNKKCYARRLERRRKSVREAYRNNLEILTTEPDTYWREVEAAIMLSRTSAFMFPVIFLTPLIFGAWLKWREGTRTAKFYVSQRSMS